jgi:uncharacterized membrane protein YgcG
MNDEFREPLLPDETDDSRSRERSRKGEDVDEVRRGPVFVCLSPASEDLRDAVQVSTVENELVFLEEILVADGERHRVQQADCEGWQQNFWSTDTSRLFTRSELECSDPEGTRRVRSIAGVSLLVDPVTWVEIQAVGSGDIRSVLTRRYRSVNPDTLTIDTEAIGLTSAVVEASAEARRRSSLWAPLSVDDIVDASGVLPIEAVEALVVENEEGYAISSDSLEHLANENVHPAIIDLMIALSFPERFVIEHDRDVDPAIYGAGMGYGYGYRPGPYYTSYAYPYYAAPFGYYYWFAPYDPFFVVQRVDTGAITQSRVFKSQGYTQVRARRTTGRFARPRGESGSGSSGGYSDSSSGGGSAGASPSGYSRGGSSGRTAKPKKR